MAQKDRRASDDPILILVTTLLYFLTILVPGLVQMHFDYPAGFSAMLTELLLKCCLTSILIAWIVRRRPVGLGAWRDITALGVLYTLLAAIGCVIATGYIVGPLAAMLVPESMQAYEGATTYMMQYPLLTAISVCVVAPITEEIVMRCYALHNLQNRYGKVIALIVSSLLFSLLHISNTYQMLSVVFTGFVLGICYLRTQKATYPILLHFFFNLIGFVLMLFA